MKSFTRFDLTSYPLLFADSAKEIHPYIGLKDRGPYQQPSKEFHYDEISVLGPDTRSAERFRNDFSTGANVVFPGGFNRIFHMDLKIVAYSYDKETALDIFSAFEKNGTFNRFPIILIKKTPKSDYDSLYYQLKAEFLKTNIVTQIFTKQTLNAAAYRWSMFPTGIQIFAKMGGRPYVLARPAIAGLGSNEKALVIGMGLTRSPIERRSIAGFVTIYDENGQWLSLKSDTQDSWDKDKLAVKLGYLITEAIKQAAQTFNFSPESGLRIILHYSGKELSGMEETALLRAIEKSSDLLHISTTVHVLKVKDSNFIVQDQSSECVDPTFNKQTGLANTGLVFSMKDFYLMITSGCIPEMKRQGKPMSNVLVSASPNPLIISFKHIGTTSADQLPNLDLLGSVYAMCRMNYTSVNNPLNRLPVTIRYSREIAWMTMRLGRISPGLEKIPWFI